MIIICFFFFLSYLLPYWLSLILYYFIVNLNFDLITVHLVVYFIAFLCLIVELISYCLSFFLSGELMSFLNVITSGEHPTDVSV